MGVRREADGEIDLPGKCLDDRANRVRRTIVGHDHFHQTGHVALPAPATRVPAANYRAVHRPTPKRQFPVAVPYNLRCKPVMLESGGSDTHCIFVLIDIVRAIANL